MNYAAHSYNLILLKEYKLTTYECKFNSILDIYDKVQTRVKVIERQQLFIVQIQEKG